MKKVYWIGSSKFPLKGVTNSVTLKKFLTKQKRKRKSVIDILF